MMTQNKADIIPNASVRLAGIASFSKPNSDETIKIGSVLETNEGALLLWLHVYPAHTQTIKIHLEDDFGAEKNEVWVLIDHVKWTPEFAVGEVTINGRTAELTLFGMPVFSATLLLKPPTSGVRKTAQPTMISHLQNSSH